MHIRNTVGIWTTANMPTALEIQKEDHESISTAINTQQSMLFFSKVIYCWQSELVQNLQSGIVSKDENYNYVSAEIQNKILEITLVNDFFKKIPQKKINKLQPDDC